MATYELRTMVFQSRQQLRADGLVAIVKAIEIISSEAVAGHAESHLPDMVQKRTGASSLASLRADQHNADQDRVVEFL